MRERAGSGPEYPLGSVEGLALEFKSVGALKSPAGIAREVVSMLNEQGGEVWIGFSERDGRADEEQDVPAPDSAKESLERSLEQRIQPWLPGDVRIEVRSRESGKNLLCIKVRSRGGDQLPVAALDDGPRFYRRSGSRVRPMEWYEVRDRFRNSGGTVALETPKQLADWRKHIESHKKDLLGLALIPCSEVTFELASPALHRLLSDPRAAGNRSSGATYGWPGAEPNDDLGELGFGPRGEREIRLTKSGLLAFQVRLDWLRAERGDPKSRRLNGLWLLEYSVSFLRLARSLFESNGDAREFLVDFVLTGARGWSLPQYAPGSMGFQVAETPDSPWPDRGLSDYALEKPMKIARDDLMANPDRIGFQLVADFYDWCKLPPDRIPSAYDRRTERFTLTD